MDLTNINIDTIIQGGAVGIAVLLIIALVILIRGILKIMGNHINHNTKAVDKLVNVIDKLDNTVETNTNQTKEVARLINSKL